MTPRHGGDEPDARIPSTPGVRFPRATDPGIDPVDPMTQNAIARARWALGVMTERGVVADERRHAMTRTPLEIVLERRARRAERQAEILVVLAVVLGIALVVLL